MKKGLLILPYCKNFSVNDKGVILKVHFGLWSSNRDSLQKVLGKAAQHLQLDEHLISRKRAAFSDRGSLDKASAQSFPSITRNQVLPCVPYNLNFSARGPSPLSDEFMVTEDTQIASFLWTLHIIVKGNYEGLISCVNLTRLRDAYMAG